MSSSSSSSKPSLVQRQLDKGLALAKDDVKAVSSLGAQAVKSTAYLYPIHGIVYLLNHPKLAKSLTPLLMRSVGISAITIIIMMLWTYLPQVAVLAFVSGPLAFIAALPLVLAESYFIIMFLHRTLISPQINERIFDAVLLERGYADLVERGRALKRRGNGGGVELGKSLLRPVTGKFSVEGLARYLFTLPLNLIPGVGTGVFLIANGLKAGPAAHARYFQLKQLDKSARKSFVEQRRGAYTALDIILETSITEVDMIVIHNEAWSQWAPKQGSGSGHYESFYMLEVDHYTSLHAKFIIVGDLTTLRFKYYSISCNFGEAGFGISSYFQDSPAGASKARKSSETMLSVTFDLRDLKSPFWDILQAKQDLRTLESGVTPQKEHPLLHFCPELGHQSLKEVRHLPNRILLAHSLLVHILLTKEEGALARRVHCKSNHKMGVEAAQDKGKHVTKAIDGHGPERATVIHHADAADVIVVVLRANFE
ncbi:hypothetical protein JCM5296_004962 [Sporobolomyces johnsonii]